MTFRDAFKSLVLWLGLGASVGALCGGAAAVFLRALASVTMARHAQVLWIWGLPLAGWAVGWVLSRVGQSAQAGNNLIIDTIHEDGPAIPWHMVPLVLAGTLVTHLFGGSAGREGTAVQMGAGLADIIAQRLNLAPRWRRPLLAAGVAGGFGAVFGTPIAGVIFALEFTVLGQLAYEALLPALVASLVGDSVAHALGAQHMVYPAVPKTTLTAQLFMVWILFAAAVALVAVLFVEGTHWLKAHAARYLPALHWRMACGGLAVVGLWQLCASDDYLGLSLPLLQRAFTDPNLSAWSFVFKALFTAITLGAGFLGGEVTPLFVVGACLGNVLATCLGVPLALGAGVGMAAMFATAANTPLALTIMAVELLGRHALPHVVVVIVVAYVLAGHRSIYPAQRLLRGKDGTPLPKLTALRNLSR